MRIEERRWRYGFLFGVGAFAVGWGAMYLLAPALTGEGTDRWLAVTWLHLNAHYISISALQTQGLSGIGSAVNYKQQVGTTLAPAIPVLSLLVAVVLTTDVVGYTQRFDHLLQNSLGPLYGYVPALFVAYVYSAANPMIAVFVAIVLILGVALYVGSAVIGQVAQIPFFGITTLTGVIGIGLVLLLAGASIFAALWRAALLCAGACASGGVLMYIARNAPT